MSLQKCAVSEAAPPAGDLSEDVDEAHVSAVQPLGEEEGYDADSESNPEDSTRQEEGTSIPHTLLALNYRLHRSCIYMIWSVVLCF